MALLLRIGAAAVLPNAAHPDETFQTREPAHRLAYGYGIVPWEFREGVRSWVFPAFLAGVMRATDWMGKGSQGYLLGIAIVLSAISLTAVWFAFAWAHRSGGINSAVVAAAGAAVWFELVYYAPKALNEVVAAHLMLPALYLGTGAEPPRARGRLFAAGLFYGLTVALRPALVPAVAAGVAWQCWRDWRGCLPVLLAGILPPIALFGLVDALTWSYPFQSFIRYFWINIVQGRSATFGVEPWYWYLLSVGRRLGPILVLAVVGARRSPFLAVVALVILVSHSLIPHKEDRFIYPLVPIALTLAALGLLDAAAWLSRRLPRLQSPGTATAVGVLFMASISVWLGSEFPLWGNNAGTLAAMEALSTDPAVCGIGLRGIPYTKSGGYTFLHRDVPIVVVLRDAQLKTLGPALSAVLTEIPLKDRQFAPAGCRHGACVYRRSGPCRAPGPENEINHYLERKGLPWAPH